MKCSLCGKSCRARARCYVAFGGGKLVQQLLGPCCTKDAVLVTAAAVEVPAKCACGGAAAVCGKCADKRASRPDGWEKDVAKKLRALADGYARAGSEDDEMLGRIEGLYQAATVVEAAKRS